MYLYQFLISRKIHVAFELLQKALGALPHSLHRSALYWWVFFFRTSLPCPYPGISLCTLYKPRHSAHTSALCAHPSTLSTPRHSVLTTALWSHLSTLLLLPRISALLAFRHSAVVSTYFSALCSHLAVLLLISPISLHSVRTSILCSHLPITLLFPPISLHSDLTSAFSCYLRLFFCCSFYPFLCTLFTTLQRAHISVFCSHTSTLFTHLNSAHTSALC